MALPPNKKEFIGGLIKFSQNKIKNTDDISGLFDSYSKDRKTFDDLIFTAKYLNGLGKILHTGITNTGAKKISSESEQDSQRKIRNEYKIHLEKFISMLGDLVNNLEETEKNKLSAKYLMMDRNSMVNITTLIYDLCWVKKYLNSEK